MGLGYNGVVKLLCACLALASVIGCASYPKEVVAERITVREIYLVDENGKTCGIIQAKNGAASVGLFNPGNARRPAVAISSELNMGVITLQNKNGDNRTRVGPAAVMVDSTSDGSGSLLPQR
jgi:hypothetical protein